jgi:hypoxanthine phosphoribosyltransferase
MTGWRLLWNLLEEIAGAMAATLIIALAGRYIVKLIVKLRRRVPDFYHSFEVTKPEIRKIKGIILKLARQEGFMPDVILGIIGGGLVGGCIIGAWLASPEFLNRRLYLVFRGEDLGDELRNHAIQNHWKNILLVDDESGTGHTVEKELAQLKTLFPEANIKVGVIVVRRESYQRLGGDFWSRHVFCYADVPMHRDVRWPWEV